MANNADFERLHLLAVAQLTAALYACGFDGPDADQIEALTDTRDHTGTGQAECFAMLDDYEARLGVDVTAVRATVEELHGISAEDSHHIHQRG